MLKKCAYFIIDVNIIQNENIETIGKSQWSPSASTLVISITIRKQIGGTPNQLPSLSNPVTWSPSSEGPPEQCEGQEWTAGRSGQREGH